MKQYEYKVTYYDPEIIDRKEYRDRLQAMLDGYANDGWMLKFIQDNVIFIFEKEIDTNTITYTQGGFTKEFDIKNRYKKQ